MNKFLIAAAAVVSTVSIPAMASSPKTPAPASSPAPSAETRYCVEGMVTGSRLIKRDCKTRAEWIKLEGFDPVAKK